MGGDLNWEKYGLKLKASLVTLQLRMQKIRLDVTNGHSDDSAEQAQERENDEVIDAIGNETERSIRLIRLALDRIESGAYGSCEKCGEEIGADRLDAVPEANYCVECAV